MRKKMYFRFLINFYYVQSVNPINGGKIAVQGIAEKSIGLNIIVKRQSLAFIESLEK